MEEIEDAKENEGEGADSVCRIPQIYIVAFCEMTFTLNNSMKMVK